MTVDIRTVVIILQLGSIVLLLALLATPTRKHPIVNTFVVASISRSIMDVLPSLLYVIRFSSELGTNLESHPGLAHFCIADTLILTYLTITKAAFAISFTLPCLYLAHKLSRPCERLEASESTSEFYRRTIVALCAGPFVWGLPWVIIVVPALRHPLQLHPSFSSTVCTVHATKAQIATLVFILIPLAIAIIVSLLLLLILWRNYKLPDLHHSVELLHPTRIIRFVALVSTTMVSAVLYSIVLATWVHSRRNIEWTECFQAWQATSAMWEAISPLIYFLIFAAQEEVYTIWYKWLRWATSCCRRRCSRSSRKTPADKRKSGHPSRQPFQVFAWLLGLCAGAERSDAGDTTLSELTATQKNRPPVYEVIEVPSGEPCRQELAGHIIQGPFPMPCLELRRHDGLTPAPHTSRSRGETPQQSPIFRTMPSLTALGGKDDGRASSGRSDKADQLGEVEEHGVESQDSIWYSSDDSRPPTPDSPPLKTQTGTFGR